MLTANFLKGQMRIVGMTLALLLVFFSTISYLISLALGPVLFFFTAEGSSVATRTIQQLPIELFVAITIQLPVRISVGDLFMIVWIIFLLCVIFAWLDRGGFPNSIKQISSKPLPLAKANFLFMMPLMATALLSSTILIQLFQEAQGVETGGLSFPPETSPYVILLELAFAPIREEFAFRITSIGVPVGIFLVYLYRFDPRVAGVKNSLKMIFLAVMSPELAKTRLGYRNVGANGFLRGISPLEWILILATSTVFGSAHYLLGGGWQIGKISTAFLAGLVLAIAFVAYGAYASILLHWFFNYYFTVVDLADSAYGGIFHVFSTLVEAINLTAGYIVLTGFLLVSALKLGQYLAWRAMSSRELSKLLA